MSSIPSCRICLATDVILHNISNSKMQEVFENLTSTKLIERRRPSTMCYLCYSQLKKCSRLLDLFRKTEYVFEILSYGIETSDHINTFLQKSKVVDLLKTPVTHLDVKPTDQGSKKTDKIIIKEEPKDEPIEVKLEAIEPEMECDLELEDVFFEDPYEESDDSAKDSTWDVLKEQMSLKNESRKTRGPDKKTIRDKLKNTQMQNDSTAKEPTFEKSNLRNIVKPNTVHVCIKCNETFSFKSNLIRHKEIFHSKSKRYPCDLCSKSFTRSDHLRLHIRTHSKVKPFPCTICDMTFTRPSSVQQHINSIHLAKKPFTCDQCNKSFSRKGNLKEHYRAHTGDKPFSCDKCDMQFAYVANMKAHMLKCMVPD